jgi:hypothetical protein
VLKFSCCPRVSFPVAAQSRRIFCANCRAEIISTQDFRESALQQKTLVQRSEWIFKLLGVHAFLFSSPFEVTASPRKTAFSRGENASLVSQSKDRLRSSHLKMHFSHSYKKIPLVFSTHLKRSFQQNHHPIASGSFPKRSFHYVFPL